MSAGWSNTNKTYPWQDWTNYMYRQSDHLEREKSAVISTYHQLIIKSTDQYIHVIYLSLADLGLFSLSNLKIFHSTRKKTQNHKRKNFHKNNQWSIHSGQFMNSLLCFFYCLKKRKENINANANSWKTE